ncbi:hypothetical protein D3C81_1208040 [compost metagenome]
MGLRQAILPVQAAGRGRLRGQQVLVEARLLPVARLTMHAEHAQIDARHCLPIQFREQKGAAAQVRRGWLQARSLQDGRFHQRERYGGGSVEDFPFMGDVVAGVLVAGVDGELLLATQHQHGGAVEHQWPQCPQFGFAQRVECLVGTHGRQDAQRVALSVVQQRRAGHRQVGDAPGAQQVAEIDHPLQLPLALAVAGPDGVVVGDVQVHGLAWQLVDQRRQMLGGQLGGLLDAGALLGVAQHGQQVLDQCLGVLRVPLQGARQARVVESGQGLVQPRAEPAEFGHQAWFHVLEAGQWLAVDVVEQAHAQRLPVYFQRQQHLAIAGRAHGGHWQALFAQVGQGRVLGLELHLGVAAVAGLEHETALWCVYTEVQVLLAAQCREVAGNAVVRLQHGMCLGFAERRAGQAGALDQRGQGRGGGLVLWAGHGALPLLLGLTVENLCPIWLMMEDDCCQKI